MYGGVYIYGSQMLNSPTLTVLQAGKQLFILVQEAANLRTDGPIM
jgi:hypothetical protein